MKRRLFLRGLGGAVVAAPFLGSLGGRGAIAQSVTPKRLIGMFTHYGCITTKFWPSNSHGPLTAESLAPTTLNPLAPFVDKLLIPRGIRGMNQWHASMKFGQGNDSHTQVCGSYFTCHPVTPNSDNPFSFNTATKFEAMPIGRSLDHVIAEQLSPGNGPLLMRVTNRTDTAQSAISYSAREQPYAGVGTPAEIFSNLTGLFRDGAPMSPDTYAAVSGKSVIDIVRDDLDTLERFDMSQSDRLKLEAWKELLDSTGTMMGSAQCNQEVSLALGATQANVDAASVEGLEDPLMAPITDTLDVADVYSNLAVLAAVCNASPVILLKYPGSHVFTGLGLNADSHTLSHRILNATGVCAPNVIDMLLAIDGYYAKKFAYLVRQLDSIDEGDGKVLDNCAAVWFPEMSDGNAHNLNNLPLVQAGSAGGYFKTGWAVNVEDGASDLSNGYSETQCNPSGDAELPPGDANTGTESQFANAPINKYYCNLMNALGVKAGADGFPAVGGTAEVTHFGMYDRTADYIGGGIIEPMIHDPGGFDALKANA